MHSNLYLEIWSFRHNWQSLWLLQVSTALKRIEMDVKAFKIDSFRNHWYCLYVFHLPLFANLHRTVLIFSQSYLQSLLNSVCVVKQKIKSSLYFTFCKVQENLGNKSQIFHKMLIIFYTTNESKNILLFAKALKK